MAERRVPVVYKENRRLVKFRDLSSVEGITDDISRRLKITDEIKLFGKRSQNDEYFDIIDDEDLEGLEDMEGLELLAKSVSDTDGGTQDDTCSFSKHASASRNDDDGFLKPSASFPRSNPGYQMTDGKRPPEYDESIPPASIHTQLKINFGDKTKIVAIQPDIEAIRDIVASRFKYDGGFQLQVKDASGTMIDIDDDEDVNHNMALMHTVWMKDTTALEISKKDKLMMIVIRKREYSFAETPSYDSDIVRTAIDNLNIDMSIQDIGSTLKDINNYLLVANYASMEDRTLHFTAQDMQLDIEKMCQECDVNMLKIKLKVSDILHEVQSGFAYFIEGFEDFGLKRLVDTAAIAKELKGEAESLTEKITKREVIIKEHREALHLVCRDIDEIATKTQNLDARSREVRESQARIREIEKQERSAPLSAKDSNSSFRFSFKRCFILPFYQGSKNCAEYQKQAAKMMKEEQEKERTRLIQLKDQELQMRRDLDEFILKIDNDKPTELSEDAIQGAESGLKNLESFVHAFSYFWELISVEFESIGNKGLIAQLAKLGDITQKRKEFCKKRHFKLEVMQLIARLVAILAMCEDFQKTLRKILNDIQFCIRENPTRKEAKEMLTQLLADMNKNKNRGEAPKPGPINSD